jgi:hypothetical protein
LALSCDPYSLTVLSPWVVAKTQRFVVEETIWLKLKIENVRGRSAPLPRHLNPYCWEGSIFGCGEVEVEVIES